MITSSDSSKICDDLYSLGPKEMPSYLLDGEAPAMFDAGIAFLGEHYITEIKKILKQRPLRYLFLTHAHFDHCGSAGHIRQEFPEVTICASPHSAKILSKPSAIKLIEKLSFFPGLSENQGFKPFAIDRTINDGDSIKISDNTIIKAIATPGHTRDMTSYFLPEKKVLIPSEAAGVPSNDKYIFSEFLLDYFQYMDSLKKLAALDFDIILFAHNSIFKGRDAQDYFPEAIKQTKEFKDLIDNLLDQYSCDHEKIVSKIKKDEYDTVEGAKQPEQAYLINLKAKIKAVERLRNN